MSDVLRCPVCSCAAFLAQFAHEIAGAARIRHSLRPLFEEGGKFSADLGRDASREGENMSILRHGERSEEIHPSACGAMVCFAALEMRWIGHGILDAPSSRGMTMVESPRLHLRLDHIRGLLADHD